MWKQALTQHLFVVHRRCANAGEDGMNAVAELSDLFPGPHRACLVVVDLALGALQLLLQILRCLLTLRAHEDECQLESGETVEASLTCVSVLMPWPRYFSI